MEQIMKNKFIKLLITFFGISIMLLIAVGSTTSSYTAPSSTAPAPGCDDFILEQYLYKGDSKAMYYGYYASGNMCCISSTSYQTEQAAIDGAKKGCEKDCYRCSGIMAVGNRVYGPSQYSDLNGIKDIRQNYRGQNNVCNTSTPGGCAGAFKP